MVRSGECIKDTIYFKSKFLGEMLPGDIFCDRKRIT